MHWSGPRQGTTRDLACYLDHQNMLLSKSTPESRTALSVKLQLNKGRRYRWEWDKVVRGRVISTTIWTELMDDALHTAYSIVRVSSALRADAKAALLLP